jgi:hypothetical protein
MNNNASNNLLLSCAEISGTGDLSSIDCSYFDNISVDLKSEKNIEKKTLNNYVTQIKEENDKKNRSWVQYFSDGYGSCVDSLKEAPKYIPGYVPKRA